MNQETNFYSQNGEDFLLWHLFKGKNAGVYIDIGAFDGIHLSNSYFFEQNGWQGVCVEAHPKYFPLCEKNRPRAVCLNKACAETGASSTVTFNAEDLGLFSGIMKESTDAISSRYQRRNTEFSGYNEVEVETISLNEIVSRHVPPGKIIDFISIDTEGTELEILRGFDFRQSRISVFVIEANDEKSAQAIIQLMRSNGYMLARSLQQNYFFTNIIEYANFLRYKRISCQIANTIHPLGEAATRPDEKGRRIEENSRWITPNVLCQQPSQPLWSLLDYFPPENTGKKEHIRIVHVVNPYPVETNPLSGKHQKLTYDSMCKARDFYGGNVDLVSIQHKDDIDLTPEGFIRGRDLDRFVSDVGEFDNPQPLPLLFDILERGAEFADSDTYIIYTNSDIILMPFFYSTVCDLIGYGFDAMNICRRTIGEHAMYLDNANFAQSDIGSYHPGSDCFVFSHELYNQFARNNSCIGKLGMPQSLLCNMAASAKNMLVLRNIHLTYHLGDDRHWDSSASKEYQTYNEKEFSSTMERLRLDPGKNKLLAAFMSSYWQKINLWG